MDKLTAYMAIGTIPGVEFEGIPRECAPYYGDGGIVYSNKNIDEDIKIVARICDDKVFIQYGYKKHGNSIWVTPYISEYSAAYGSFRNIGDTLTFEYPDAMHPLELLEIWLKMQTLVYADWFAYIEAAVNKVRDGTIKTRDNLCNNKVACARIKTMDNNPNETFVYKVEIGYKPGQLLLTSLYAYDKATNVFQEIAPNGKGTFNRERIFGADSSAYAREEFKPLRVLYKDIFKEVSGC